MKASELLDLVNSYQYYSITPSDLDVHFGCDCGCGGDSYTSEEWDSAHKMATKVEDDFKKALKELNIEWDLVDREAC